MTPNIRGKEARCEPCFLAKTGSCGCHETSGHAPYGGTPCSYQHDAELLCDVAKPQSVYTSVTQCRGGRTLSPMECYFIAHRRWRWHACLLWVDCSKSTSCKIVPHTCLMDDAREIRETCVQWPARITTKILLALHLPQSDFARFRAQV